MNLIVKSIFVVLLTSFSIVGCSSSPELPEDQGNSADDQRSRAKQAQDELSSETSR
jgi:uncharacterized protein YcfL